MFYRLQWASYYQKLSYFDRSPPMPVCQKTLSLLMRRNVSLCRMLYSLVYIDYSRPTLLNLSCCFQGYLEFHGRRIERPVQVYILVLSVSLCLLVRRSYSRTSVGLIRVFAGPRMRSRVPNLFLLLP